MTEEQWLRLDQARHAVRTRHYATGAPQLEKLLCELRDSPQAWGMLAICYDALGNGAQAESAARRALALAPEDPVLRRNLGVFLWNRGAREEAEAILATCAPPAEEPAEQPVEELAESPAEDRPGAEEDEWAPFLEEEAAPPGGPARLEPEVPTLPPAPPSTSRRKREPVVFPPYGATRCVGIGFGATLGHFGEIGGIALLTCGSLFGLGALTWSLSRCARAYLGPEAEWPPYLVGFILAVLLLAAIGYVGVRLADARLTGDNPPILDDLWTVFSEWGLVGLLALTRIGAMLLALLPAALAGALGARVLGPPGWAVGLALAPAALWAGARLWFGPALAMTAEQGYVEALATSWVVTRGHDVSLSLLVLLTLVLAVAGPSLAVAGGVAFGQDWRCGLAVALGLLVTAVLLPAAAGTAGAAFRLLVAEVFPEDDNAAQAEA